MNKKAIDIFISYLGEIESLLDAIKDCVVENHMDISPEDVTWGDVSSVSGILQRLKELADFAGISREEK